MKWPFVEIEWLDAHSCPAWVEDDDLLEPARFVTRGWLLRDEKTYVVLAASIQIAEDDAFGECIAIPKGCIVKRRVIRK